MDSDDNREQPFRHERDGCEDHICVFDAQGRQRIFYVCEWQSDWNSEEGDPEGVWKGCFELFSSAQELAVHRQRYQHTMATPNPAAQNLAKPGMLLSNLG